MATIRELLVRIGIKTDEKKLRSLDSAIGFVKKGLVGLTGLALGATAAMFGLANSAATAGDEFAKAAQRLGITSEELQELKFAAERSGAAMADVENSIRKITVAQDNAVRGGKKQIELFDRIGISVEDLRGKDSITLLEDIAEGLNGVEDKSTRNAISFGLLGRSGQALQPLLNAGASGIRELRQEAQDLGIVMSDADSVVSEEFMDRMLEFELILKGLKNSIGVALMPIFNEMLWDFREWWKINGDIVKQKITKWVDNLVDGLKDLYDWGGKIVDTFGGVENTLKLLTVTVAALGAAFTAIKISSGVMTALETIAAILGVTVGAAASTVALIVAVVVVAIAEYTALILVLADFFAYFSDSDKKSAIGEFVKRFSESEGVLGSVARLLESIKGLVLTLADALKGPLSKAFKAIKDFVSPLLESMQEQLSKIADWVGVVIVAAIDDVASTIRVLADLIDLFSTDSDTAIQAVIDRFKELVSLIPGGSLALETGEFVGGGGVQNFAASIPSTASNVVNSVTNTVAGATVNIQGILNESNIPDTVGRITNSIMRNARAAFAGGDI